ncbi:MAG: efflux RND transporter periplasmic adaptor subunit [Sphingobium sp.]
MGILLALVGVLLLIALLLWYVRPTQIAVARAHRGEAVGLVYATGFVEPTQPVSVIARLTAPVTAIYAAEGDRVRRGQPLVRLDDGDLRNTLDEARAQSRGASLTEQRSVALYKQGWATKASRDSAVATAEAARAAERAAGAKLGQYVIRAGIDGIVIKRDVEPGDLATPTRVLMQLGDPARTRITATIDERDISRIHAGQKALLSSDAWPDRIVNGHVTMVTPTGNPNERAFRARLAIDDKAELPMGMTLEVNIISRRVANAVLIPTSALDNGHVWLVKDGRLHRQQVRTGISGTRETQILSGLADGAQIADQPSEDMREGMRVRPLSQ